jgi:hypothetical protein
MTTEEEEKFIDSVNIIKLSSTGWVNGDLPVPKLNNTVRFPTSDPKSFTRNEKIYLGFTWVRVPFGVGVESEWHRLSGQKFNVVMSPGGDFVEVTRVA